jgi:16S rRNA (guanine527-N7)-methyltransferase
MFHVEQQGFIEREIPPEIRVRSICRKNGLQLTDGEMRKLSEFVAGLLEWNVSINLISRKDTDRIWFSHILHSLAPLFYVRIPPEWRVFDLGTGGGFPGIPLAIARPDLRFTLADSTRKKIVAVEELVTRLGLGNVRVRTGRAEEIGKEKGVAGCQDLVIARAVAPLADLLEWSKPLSSGRIPPGGEGIPVPALIALKGGDLEREIQEARRKWSRCAITVINMSFEGSLELGLEDKKLVLTQF